MGSSQKKRAKSSLSNGQARDEAPVVGPAGLSDEERGEAW
jgi:hypothetical protein